MFLRKQTMKGRKIPMESIAQKQGNFEKEIKNLNLKARFDNKNVTSVATFTYVELFKRIIGYKDVLKNSISFNKAANATFTVADIIDYLTDANILGFSRFSHTTDLKDDQGYKKVKGTGKLPSEKVCRDLLKTLPDEALKELKSINKQILEIKSLTEEVREICINIDDTVVTIFGNQEGSSVGYNPRYHGRPSFKEKVGFIAGSNELLDITLESGKHHSNYEFLEFFKGCTAQLPKRYILKRVRLDRGFFDEKNFLYFEDEGIEYVAKSKMLSTVKQIIAYINSNPNDYTWEAISSQFDVTEITVPLPKWEKARRFIIVRERLQPKLDRKQLMFEELSYSYQVIVTNIDYLTPEEIFHEYNQRCDVENKIDEVKEGYAFSENSMLNHKANELYLLIKMIAFNISNWFKQAVMPKEVNHHEISTLRRLFFRVSGNICGNGTYRHISFAPNEKLKGIIKFINNEIIVFSKKVCIAFRS